MIDNVVVPVTSTYGLSKEYEYLKASIAEFLTGYLFAPRTYNLYHYSLLYYPLPAFGCFSFSFFLSNFYLYLCPSSF